MTDHADAEPVPNDDPDEHGGRGLQIIDTLADRWGTTHNEDGKTVWAEFTRTDRTEQ